MLADRVLPNLLLFAIGLAVAVAWLRTGMVARGGALLALLLVTADAALLLRFAFADRGAPFVAALGAMQLLAVGSLAVLAWQVLRSRLAADVRRRRELFDAGMRHYLRGELDPAMALFRRLHRADPWHVPSAIAVASVLAAQGRTRRARRLLLVARRLDRAGAWRDLVALRLQRVG